MSALVFVEDPLEELSQQAVAFATGFDSDRDIDTVAFDGPYAPAAWAQALVERIGRRGPSAVLAPGTDRGNEVLAHVAAILDQPLAANCTAVTPGSPATVTRIRWGGSLLEEARLHGEPLLLTVAPHVVAAAPVGEVEVITVDAAGAPAAKERVPTSAGGISLADADVVVSGGRGVGSAEGFAVIEELADLLVGAVGVSRVVTSQGWRPHREQVGQTGTRISPELYLACGISGAIQHMAGCLSAKHLVAINTDPDAPIMSRAGHALIGDLHEILPALVVALRERRGLGAS